MSTRHDPEQEFRQLLRDDGGELGALYRRLPGAEPPRRLDRAVLGTAARAVFGEPRPRRRTWMLTAGYAAGVVLAAGIAWRVGQDTFGRYEGAAPAARVIPVEPVERTRTRLAKPSPALPENKVDVLLSPAPTAGAPAGRTQPAAAKVAAKSEKPAAGVAVPQAFPAGSATLPSPKPTLSPAAALPPAVQQPFVEPAEARARRESAPSTAVETGAASATIERAGSVPAATAAQAARAQSAPAEWIARIRNLLQAGQRARAAGELRRFRRAYPQASVPNDLLELEK